MYSSCGDCGEELSVWCSPTHFILGVVAASRHRKMINTHPSAVYQVVDNGENEIVYRGNQYRRCMESFDSSCRSRP
jgi:hypothetical protein